MSIEVRETRRRYRYLGIELPAPPGMSPEQVRDLHSTLYPELVSADIVVGELTDGVQEVTFVRAVGTKGNRLQALRSAVDNGTLCAKDGNSDLASAMTLDEVRLCSSIWERSTRCEARNHQEQVAMRAVPAWSQLPPVA